MAPVLPNSREQMIQWFNQRIVSWGADPTTIGLTALQVADLAGRLAAAQTDESTAFDARINSKNATTNYYTSSDDLRNFGGDLIKTIKAFAETTDNTGVYTAASVPPPSPPTPLGPPATPKNLSSELNTAGEIELEWNSSRVGGTSFTIERSTTGGAEPWTIVGTSEEAAFTDTAVPSGVVSVAYRVIASRSGGSSNPTPPLVIYFGNTGSTSEETASGDTDLTIAA
jgi:hypothetical protein